MHEPAREQVFIHIYREEEIFENDIVDAEVNGEDYLMKGIELFVRMKMRKKLAIKLFSVSQEQQHCHCFRILE